MGCSLQPLSAVICRARYFITYFSIEQKCFFCEKLSKVGNVIAFNLFFIDRLSKFETAVIFNMVCYTYVECTGSCFSITVLFKNLFSSHMFYFFSSLTVALVSPI